MGGCSSASPRGWIFFAVVASVALVAAPASAQDGAADSGIHAAMSSPPFSAAATSTSPSARPPWAPPLPDPSVSQRSPQAIPPPPPAGIDQDELHLHLDSEPPGLTFFVQTIDDPTPDVVSHGVGYNRLCTAPCDALVSSGTHVLALGPSRNAPAEAGDPIDFERNTSLRGRITSFPAGRVGVLFVSLAFMAVGSVIILQGLGGEGPVPSWRWIACGVSFGLGASGMVLAGFLGDAAEITRAP